MEEELKCKVCGKLASEDCNFNKKRQLCNAHNLQYLRHGKIIDKTPIRNYLSKDEKVCAICGDREHKRYYTWDHFDIPIVVCGKHYNQLINNGEIIDPTPSEHKEKGAWTKEELKLLEDLYANGKSYGEIATILGKTTSACSAMGSKIKLGDKYFHPGNIKAHYPYQEYGWLFEQLITLGKMPQQIADEFGYSRRVIEKWAGEKYNINNRTFKDLVRLTNLQRMIILAGTLGDGHIANNNTYIESHAENQKDYLFWKYNMLRNLCLSEPTYYPATKKVFDGKTYMCKPYYRLTTRQISQLRDIKNMSAIDRIAELNGLGVALHFLDDGSCDKLGRWSICVAGWSSEEIDKYISKVLEYKIKLSKVKDTRYLNVNKDSSYTLSELILNEIPNDLDIVQYKILKTKADII